jgi:hypothetical protein
MQGNSGKPAAQQQAQPGTQPAGPQAQPAAQGLTIRVVDRPECEEIFADSVTGLYFDGQTLRMELSVTRLDDVKQNTPITGRRYPACRLVLSPAAAVELINRTQQIAAALRQANTAQQKTAEEPAKGTTAATDNDASII